MLFARDHKSEPRVLQEEEYLSGFGVENSHYGGGYVEGYSSAASRARLVSGGGLGGGPGLGPGAAAITSELEGDKMVLKIAKPPRDKDSLMALSWQCCSWMVTVSRMFRQCFDIVFICKHQTFCHVDDDEESTKC